MIGVSDDKFWELNPKKLEPYVKAFSLKEKMVQRNIWETGLYIRLAIASCIDKKVKYPTKPLDVEQDTPQKRQEVIRNRFLNRMIELNSRFK